MQSVCACIMQVILMCIHKMALRTVTTVSSGGDVYFLNLCHYYAPAPVGEAGALGGHRRLSSVRLSVHPSVCLMSRTSALTRKSKGLGIRNFAQRCPRSHATPTPTSRSKGQKSRWGGGILWRRPSRTACYYYYYYKRYTHLNGTVTTNAASALYRISMSGKPRLVSVTFTIHTD